MNSGQLILSEHNMGFLGSIHGRPGKTAFSVNSPDGGDELSLTEGQHLFLDERNWAKAYLLPESLEPGAIIRYGMVPLTHVYDVHGKTSPPVITVAEWISRCKTTDADAVRAEVAEAAAASEDEETVLKPQIRALTTQLDAMVAENTRLQQKLSASTNAAPTEAPERPDPAQELRQQLAELEAAYKKLADEQKAGSRVIRRLRMEQKREQRKQAAKPY